MIHIQQETLTMNHTPLTPDQEEFLADCDRNGLFI